MKSQHVGIGGLGEIRPNAVDDRVGHLVGDNVLREAGENELAGEISTLSGFVRGEVAKQNSVRLRAVVGIGLLHSVRVELEDPDIIGLAEFVFLVCRTYDAIGPAPVNLASQGYFKHLDGAGCDGVDHLLMETRVRFRGIEAIIGQQPRVLEINRRVVALVGSVVVNDCDLVPGWSGLKWFPRNPHRNLIPRVFT